MPFQDEAPEGARSHGQGRRVALVIGNGAYRHTPPLRNPANDAKSMDAALRSLGFEVVGGEENGVDLSYGDLAQRIRDFGRRLRDGETVSTALLFYAGHGLQVAGRNYLVPTDAVLNYEGDVGSELYELQFILNQMERRDRTSIVLLDACRNNPLAKNLARAMGLEDARAAGIAEGLAAQKVVAGTLIAYATQPEHVAYDGDGANGFFTEALLADLPAPGLEIGLMLRQVRARVVEATKRKPRGAQVPWDHSSLMGAFYFKPAPISAPVPEPPAPPSPPPGPGVDVLSWSRAEWETLKGSTDIARLKRFAAHAHSYYAGEAEARIAEIEAEARHRAEEAARAEAEALHQAEVARRKAKAVRLKEREDAARLEAEAAEKRRIEELKARYESDWAKAQAAGTVAAYEAFLAAWDGGRHNAAAKAWLEADRAKVAARGKTYRITVGVKADSKTVELAPGDSVRDADFAPELVLVPPGKFWMGSKDGEGNDSERPRREVTIGAPLLVGKYPVTFAEWDAFDRAGGIIETREETSGVIFKKTETIRNKHTPSDAGWGRGKRPVINVNWNDAKAYAKWLSEATGEGYRLLSEAEWEHCCRAGTETQYSFGDDEKALGEYAWFNSNAGGKTQPVGQKKANAFGLHDMHGNVWEWCEDPWHENYKGAPVDGSVWSAGGDTNRRVLRGGSWNYDPGYVRSADRDWGRPVSRLDFLGVRLARMLTP